MIIGNSVTGKGYYCDQPVPGNFQQPIVSVGNRWNTAPTCAATLQPGQ